MGVVEELQDETQPSELDSARSVRTSAVIASAPFSPGCPDSDIVVDGNSAQFLSAIKATVSTLLDEHEGRFNSHLDRGMARQQEVLERLLLQQREMEASLRRATPALWTNSLAPKRPLAGKSVSAELRAAAAAAGVSSRGSSAVVASPAPPAGPPGGPGVVSGWVSPAPPAGSAPELHSMPELPSQVAGEADVGAASHSPSEAAGQDSLAELRSWRPPPLTDSVQQVAELPPTPTGNRPQGMMWDLTPSLGASVTAREPMQSHGAMSLADSKHPEGSQFTRSLRGGDDVTSECSKPSVDSIISCRSRKSTRSKASTRSKRSKPHRKKGKKRDHKQNRISRLSDFTDKRGISYTEAEDKKCHFFKKVVRHQLFEPLFGMAIAINTLILGIETDYIARHSESASPREFTTVRNCLLIVFCIELVFRSGASGGRFLTGVDWQWNIFDSVMVLLSIAEFFIEAMVTDLSSTSRVLRIVRVVRVTRTLRLGRMLRYARAFQRMAYAIQSSAQTLLWALLTIFLVIYCFAVVFTQGSSDHLASVDSSEWSSHHHLMALQEYYGTLPLSLYSLYRAMTNGQAWGELLQPWRKVNGFYVSLFLCYLSVSTFGVLNSVTAIFVESALESQQHYKELLIQENVLKKARYERHLRRVFNAMDTDGCGTVTFEEMEYFLSDPQVNLYLESIDIFPNDARALFALLDRDDSGQVSIEEFCDGCNRLKGEAKSFDVHCVIFNSEKIAYKVQKLARRVEEMHKVLVPIFAPERQVSPSNPDVERANSDGSGHGRGGNVSDEDEPDITEAILSRQVSPSPQALSLMRATIY